MKKVEALELAIQKMTEAATRPDVESVDAHVIGSVLHPDDPTGWVASVSSTYHEPDGTLVVRKWASYEDRNLSEAEG